MKTVTQRVVIAAMLAALVCVATMIVRIPSPMKGYVNLGDAVVLLSAWLLSPGYGALAAGLGSALADLFSGYTIYAPVTFAVKAVMALVAYGVAAMLSRRFRILPSRVIGGAAAELVMISGYYVFEGVLYGFVPALVNIPANAAQGVAGMIGGILLIAVFEKQNLTKILK